MQLVSKMKAILLFLQASHLLLNSVDICEPFEYPHTLDVGLSIKHFLANYASHLVLLSWRPKGLHNSIFGLIICGMHSPYLQRLFSGHVLLLHFWSIFLQRWYRRYSPGPHYFLASAKAINTIRTIIIIFFIINF